MRYIALIVLAPYLCFAADSSQGPEESFSLCSSDSYWRYVSPGYCLLQQEKIREIKWSSVFDDSSLCGLNGWLANPAMCVFLEATAEANGIELAQAHQNQQQHENVTGTAHPERAETAVRASSDSNEVNGLTQASQIQIIDQPISSNYLRDCFNDVCEPHDIPCKKKFVFKAAGNYGPEKGDIKVIDTFLKCGGDPNMQEADGDYGKDIPTSRKWSLLHMASNSGLLDIVILLIQWNADVNITDLSGETPMYRAVIPCGNFQAQLQIVTLLHEEGADVNHRSNCNETPLHNVINYLCPEQDKFEMVKHLVSLGAKTQTINCADSNPLDNARFMNSRGYNNASLVEFLMDRED